MLCFIQRLIKLKTVMMLQPECSAPRSLMIYSESIIANDSFLERRSGALVLLRGVYICPVAFLKTLKAPVARYIQRF